MISTVGLGKSVTSPAGGIHILRDVNFDVEAGELVAVTGPSGSGKTTLLNIIGLLDRPTCGEYYLDGHEVGRMPARAVDELRSGSIGFVFQAFHLLGQRSVTDNVGIGLLHSGVPRRERSTRISRALETVGLSHRADFTAATLSGGEKQRVAIARAVAGSKRVLLCDEPTGNLDSVASAAVVDLLLTLHATGMTVVIVTHDRTVANRCRRIVEVRDGRLDAEAASAPIRA